MRVPQDTLSTKVLEGGVIKIGAPTRQKRIYLDDQSLQTQNASIQTLTRKYLSNLLRPQPIITPNDGLVWEIPSKWPCPEVCSIFWVVGFRSTSERPMTSSSGAPGRVEGFGRLMRSDSRKGTCGTKPPISLRQRRWICNHIWGYMRLLLQIYNAQWTSQMSRKGLIQPFLQQSSSCPLSIRMFWARQDLKKSEAFEAFGIVTPMGSGEFDDILLGGV